MTSANQRAALPEWAEAHALDPQVLAEALQRVHPFSKLSKVSLQVLCRAGRAVTLSRGERILVGEQAARALYVVVTGSVQEFGASTSARVPGALIGHEDVVAGSALSRCFVATLPTRLCAFDAELVRTVARSEPVFAAWLREDVLLQRPVSRGPGVVESWSPDHTQLVIESPGRNYMRLDAWATRVWAHIDGQRTVPDLMSIAIKDRLARLLAPGTDQAASASAQVVASGSVLDMRGTLQLCTRLQEQGFLSNFTVSSTWGSPSKPSALQRFAACGWFLWSLRGVGPQIRRLYNLVGYLFFRPGMRWLLCAITLVGMAAWCVNRRAGMCLPATSAIALYAIAMLAIVLHELGHAFAMVRAGVEVDRVGVGWCWFGPVAFVDTTAAWAASRRDRIGISLAGPCVTLMIAATASIVAWLAHGDTAGIAAITADANYLGAVMSLNPFLKLDGYLVLADLVERPNLRRDALHRLRQFLSGHGACSSRAADGWQVLYGAGVVACVSGFAVLAWTVIRPWLAALFVPLFGSSASLWIAAALVIFASAAGFAELVLDSSRRTESWL